MTQLARRGGITKQHLDGYACADSTDGRRILRGVGGVRKGFKLTPVLWSWIMGIGSGFGVELDSRGRVRVEWHCASDRHKQAIGLTLCSDKPFA